MKELQHRLYTYRADDCCRHYWNLSCCRTYLLISRIYRPFASNVEAVNIIAGLKIEFTNAFGSSGQCPVNGVDGFEVATLLSR
jgi:hypothetical protein